MREVQVNPETGRVHEFEPLSEEKKKGLAVTNLLFATIALIGTWMIPMFTKDWHVKRWYAALGVAGKLEMHFGLLGYHLYVECSQPFQGLCDKLGGDLGAHSYFDLADRMCNIQHTFTSAVFRGCDSLHMLTYSSLTTFVLLCLGLWCLVMGAGLVCLYFNGYATKKLYNWILAFYSAAPAVQFIAVIIYCGTTYDMRRFMDFGVIENYRFVKAIAGSSHVVTFSFSTIGSLCLCFVSALPVFIIVQCITRDKKLWKHAEEDALLAEWQMYEEAMQGGSLAGYGAAPGGAPYPAPGGAPYPAPGPGY